MNFTFSDKLYNRLKTGVQVVLPASATLVLTLGTIWHFAYAEEIAGSIVAFTTFLGISLKISSSNYETPTEGQLFLDSRGGHRTMLNVELDKPEEEYLGQDLVTFRVREVKLPPGE